MFVKCPLYFFSIIIRYLVRWGIGILNLCYSKNLFSPSGRVTFSNVVFFFVILTLSPTQNLGLMGSAFKLFTLFKFLHTMVLFFFILASSGDIFMEECLVLL